MKTIKVVTELLDKRNEFWKPFSFIGFLLRCLLFLVLLSVFVLLFCIQQECREPIDPDDTQEQDEILEPVPHTGQVQITLKWHDVNDLDLSCVDPSGENINFSHKKSSSGGELDIDTNAGEDKNGFNPVENIYWPDGEAPKGKYKVYLTMYSKNPGAPDNSSYTIDVKYEDIYENYNGTISKSDGTILICTFTLQ